MALSEKDRVNVAAVNLELESSLQESELAQTQLVFLTNWEESLVFKEF